MDFFIQKVVSPSTSGDIGKTEVILPLKSLAFRGYKCLGMFLSPRDVENLDKLPYSSPFTKSQLPLNGTEIHFCFCPEIPTTIIPIEIGGLLGDIDRLKVKETKCSLQKQGCEKKYQKLGAELSGYSARVKFDFLLMHGKDEARKFHLDGALILDLTHPLLSLPNPICLIGMDFMVKHPHLLFETRLDKRKELSFRLAKVLSQYRRYEIPVNNQNEVIVSVEDHHNENTENLGCGIFFKTGSVFNSFCGVSKSDILGTELNYYWKERGLLVGILKALQIVETFSTGRNLKPASVVIRTSNADIESILSPIKASSQNRPQSLWEEDFVESDRSLERDFPLAIRDVAMYYHDNFVKRNPGYKIKYQHVNKPDNLGGALSAKLLAIAGSEMEEFYIESGSTGLECEGLRGYPKKRWPSSRGAVPLISHPGTRDSSLYVSFGFDGYYFIQRERTHMVMDLADQAGSTLIPDGKNQVISGQVLKEDKHVLSRNPDSLITDPSSPTDLSGFESDWYTWTKVSAAEWDLGMGQGPSKINVEQSQKKTNQDRSMREKSSDSLEKEWIESIRREYRNAKAQSKVGGEEVVDLSKVLELWKTGPNKMMKAVNNDSKLLCHIDCGCRTEEGACLCRGPNGSIQCECGPPLTSPKELDRSLHKLLEPARLTDRSPPPKYTGEASYIQQWGIINTQKPSCCSQKHPKWAEEDNVAWESVW
ncbi:uncharacterized protein H6S33_004399 [Morchella sextelata]|uniref:uncharacterized protein n=1 Tax=Morchella sextelata TaxID=1174677 RepID=UPI001D05B9B0|nr:uncharacterized protein H6S33_004399 [Morchella sextelata]KAH0605942.1 hypothetical protein H6S33_004399 [Morchella sextelata]